MGHIKPKKSLGQHFLKDSHIIRRIAATIPAKSSEDRVIEIGPGTGMLTRELLNRFESLRCVELDGRAVTYFQQELPGLDIIHGDILDISWDDLLTWPDDETEIHVVGNLPYFITSQILFKILEHRHRLKSATLMMQREVAERIVASPRNKTYGILSVQTQLMSTPHIMFDVDRTSFYPPPDVTSSVVMLQFDRPPLDCSDTHLKRVVRTAFQQRRKKLKNSLSGLGLEKLPDDPLFDYDKRAEAWEPHLYEKLAARLEQDGTLA